MKKSVFAIVLAALTVLAGCVPCLRAIYTDEGVVFKPELVGVWSQPHQKETWQFTAAGEKSYRLVQTDKEGRKGAFSAHLVKLEGALFLDLSPETKDLPGNNFSRCYLYPLHTFFLVEELGSALRLSAMDGKWLEKCLKRNPAAIRHERIKGSIMLTASTAELQEFLIKHSKTEGAFGTGLNMKRHPGS